MPNPTHHNHDGADPGQEATASVTTVLDVRGLHWATEQAVIEQTLGRLDGVMGVEPNAVAQTATVAYDPDRISVADLLQWVEQCGYHCAGQSVPEHLCHPMTEPRRNGTVVHDHHAHPITASDGGPAPVHSPHDMMGHGGMSMADMVADMRRRFLIAVMFSVPIVLWSSIGRDVLGFNVAAPFGLRDDVFQLLLSLPVLFYSSWIFFDGAYRALKARTLDMMVLVAVGVGAGWLYSVGVSLSGGGEVFYEAATVLAAFVLLGHWFEMRARGGANEAIRALLNLAPPMASVIRDNEVTELPTAAVIVGDRKSVV